MRRFLLLVALLPAVLLRAPVPVAAQGASPTGSSQLPRGLLDLPAMTLMPTDLPQPGYGLLSSMTQTAGERVQSLVSVAGNSARAREGGDRLAALGFRRGYVNYLALPQEPGAASPAFKQQILSYVEEYTNPAAAAAGFDLVQAESRRGDPTAQSLAPTRRFGDRSQLTRFGAAPDAGNAGGTPSGSLDLEVQLGALDAGVTLFDYDGATSDPSVVEGLVATLQAKIAQVLQHGGPGLSNQVLRLTIPPALASSAGTDTYLTLNGTTVPSYNDAKPARPDPDGATVVYRVNQHIGPASDAPVYRVTLEQFPDAAAAASWLPTVQAGLAKTASIVDLSPVAGAATIGDASITLTFAAKGGPHITLVAVRNGATGIVATLRGNVQPAPRLVEQLVRAQLACFGATGPCQPVPAPADLEDVGTPIPGGF